jgi:hypothetical protein
MFTKALRIALPSPLIDRFVVRLKKTGLPNQFFKAAYTATTCLSETLQESPEGVKALKALPLIHHHPFATVEGLPIGDDIKRIKVDRFDDVSSPCTQESLLIPSVTMLAVLALAGPEFLLGVTKHHPRPQLLTPFETAHPNTVHAKDSYMHTDSVGTNYDVKRAALLCVNNEQEIPTIFIPLEVVKNFLPETVIATLKTNSFYVSTSKTPFPRKKKVLFPVLNEEGITYSLGGIVHGFNKEAEEALNVLNNALALIESLELGMTIPLKPGNLILWKDALFLHTRGEPQKNIHPTQARMLLRYLLTEQKGVSFAELLLKERDDKATDRTVDFF